jgi:hypothetical protein
VFPRYSNIESAFQWAVSAEQWEKVENINQFLAIFNEVTNIVSGSNYPTSNLFLPKVGRIKEILSIKSMDQNGYIREMASVMEEKFHKYWGGLQSFNVFGCCLGPKIQSEVH